MQTIRVNTSSVFNSMFILTNLMVIISSFLPIFDYVAIIIFFVLSYIVRQSFSRNAIICSLCVVLTLGLGVFLSYFNGINNNSWITVIGISFNFLLYINAAYNFPGFSTEQQIYNVFKLVNIVGLTVCVYNVITNIGDIMSLSLTSNAYSANFCSIYQGRNAFGFVLCIFIFSAFGLFIFIKEKKYLFSLAFFFVNLILTFSRSSILFSGIIILLFYLLDSKNSIKRKLLYTFIATLIGMIGIIIYSTYSDFIEHFLLRSDYADSNRIDYWELALDKFADSPLFGYGPGCALPILSVLGSNAGSSFHNTYVEIIAWGGISFIIVYIYIYASVFKSISIIKYHNKTLYNLFLSFIIGYLIYSCFETSNYFAIGFRGVNISLFMYVFPILCSRLYSKY